MKYPTSKQRILGNMLCEPAIAGVECDTLIIGVKYSGAGRKIGARIVAMHGTPAHGLWSAIRHANAAMQEASR